MSTAAFTEMWIGRPLAEGEDAREVWRQIQAERRVGREIELAAPRARPEIERAAKRLDYMALSILAGQPRICDYIEDERRTSYEVGHAAGLAAAKDRLPRLLRWLLR